MDDLLCCARCKEPLKIVCEAHGTEWVPDRRVNVVPAPGALPVGDVPYASFRQFVTDSIERIAHTLGIPVEELTRGLRFVGPSAMRTRSIAPPSPTPAPSAPAVKPAKRVQRVQAAPLPHTRRGRIFAQVSDNPSTPSIARPIADALELTIFTVATELSNMCAEGYLKRVGRGQYIRRPQRGGADAGV